MQPADHSQNSIITIPNPVKENHFPLICE